MKPYNPESSPLKMVQPRPFPITLATYPRSRFTTSILAIPNSTPPHSLTISSPSSTSRWFSRTGILITVTISTSSPCSCSKTSSLTILYRAGCGTTDAARYARCVGKKGRLDVGIGSSTGGAACVLGMIARGRYVSAICPNADRLTIS